MSVQEYKNFKGIRKKSLRDNMTYIEVALTDLSEITTRELAKKHKMVGEATKVARDNIDKNLGKTIISSENSLNYKYQDKTAITSNQNN